MEGESSEKVENELESDLCKVDGKRHEVDSRAEVMHSEMTNW